MRLNFRHSSDTRLNELKIAARFTKFKFVLMRFAWCTGFGSTEFGFTAISLSFHFRLKSASLRLKFSLSVHFAIRLPALLLKGPNQLNAYPNQISDGYHIMAGPIYDSLNGISWSN